MFSYLSLIHSASLRFLSEQRIIVGICWKSSFRKLIVQVHKIQNHFRCLSKKDTSLIQSICLWSFSSKVDELQVPSGAMLRELLQWETAHEKENRQLMSVFHFKPEGPIIDFFLFLIFLFNLVRAIVCFERFWSTVIIWTRICANTNISPSTAILQMNEQYFVLKHNTTVVSSNRRTRQRYPLVQSLHFQSRWFCIIKSSLQAFWLLIPFHKLWRGEISVLSQLKIRGIPCIYIPLVSNHLPTAKRPAARDLYLHPPWFRPSAKQGGGV